MRNLKRLGSGLAVLSVSALATTLLACAGQSDGATTGEPEGSSEVRSEAELEELDGEIRIDGSSTVFPISEAMAEEFGRAGAGTRVNVGFSGTGGGFEKFCRGETEISNASRPIKESELAACAEAGIDDVVELQVAIDALTVMVNPANDFVDCLTVDQLHELFRGGGATSWSELNPAWPDEQIAFYVPGTDSGTFDYFVEAIIEGVDDGATHRGDVTSSEDDNVLLQGIASDANAIGYFGFAYFLEAEDQLRAVAVDGGAGCVEPSFEAALSGDYQPLSRPLFIYTSAALLRERAEVREFLRFYLEHLDEIVPEVGYVTMDADTAELQRQKLADAVSG